MLATGGVGRGADKDGGGRVYKLQTRKLRAQSSPCDGSIQVWISSCKSDGQSQCSGVMLERSLVIKR